MCGCELPQRGEWVDDRGDAAGDVLGELEVRPDRAGRHSGAGLFVSRLRGVVKAATRDVRLKQSELVSILQEGLGSIRVVKAERGRLETKSLESMTYLGELFRPIQDLARRRASRRA